MKYTIRRKIKATFLLLGIILLCLPAKAQTELPEGANPMIVTPHKQSTDYKERTLCYNIAANIDYTVTSDQDWATVRKGKKGSVYVHVAQNYQTEERKANIIFNNSEKKITSTLTIVQERDKSADELPTDIYIRPSSATDNSHTTSGTDGDITNTYDNDLNTLYHSNYNSTVSEENPAILTYNFTNTERIDYINYIPRRNSSNGHFGKVEVSYKLAGDADYTVYRTYDWGMTSEIKTVFFKEGLENPVSVRFTVTSGGNGFATCAEMQFFAYNKENEEEYAIFADDIYSKLKEDVTQNDIDKLKSPFVKSLATKIFNGTYSTDYRVNTFPCLLSVKSLAESWNCPDKYYDQTPGVTGISFTPGKHVIIVSGLPEEKTATLKLVAWYNGIRGDNFDGGDPQENDFQLRNGINIIEYDPESNSTFAEGGYKKDYDALAYIDYNADENPHSYPDISVHFVNGTVNGYLSLDKTNEEMHELTANAKNWCMDVVGRKVHAVWTSEGLHNYCKSTDGGLGYRQYMNVLDSLVQWEHRVLGFEKYGLVPENRTFAYVNYTYYMFQGGRGVSFHYGQESRVLNCNTLINNDDDAIWGLSHEWGHQHQMHPYFCWKGVAEVTNNVNSYFNIMRMGYRTSDKINQWAPARRHYINDNLSSFNKRSSLRGTAFRRAEAMSWNEDFHNLCLSMKDSMITTHAENPALGPSYLETSAGEMLCPFIMVYVYFTQNGFPDFAPDWYEALRQTDIEGGSTIEKTGGYDKYELVAAAQNWNKNNALAILAEKFPESVWNKYITAEQCNSNNNNMPFILNYIRKVSRLSGYNLFPYFERWGFLRQVALLVNDYGEGWQLFTKAAYDEFKADMDSLVSDGTLKEMPEGMVEEISNCNDMFMDKPAFPN